MPDVVVTILTPTLTGSDYFKTRYRLLPAGSYTGNVNRTNAPFTLTGLAVGSYEMEIIFVDVEGAEETDCPAKIFSFTVDPDFECFDFEAEIVQNGSLYELVITYALPSPLSWPPCGFDIVWNQGGKNNTIHYTTLPLGGEIRYTLPANLNTNLTVLADMCGYFNVCFEEQIPKIADPDCDPAIVTGHDIQYAVIGQYFNIRAFVTNSMPTTDPYVFMYQEISQVNVGDIPDSGSTIFTNPGGAGQPLFFGAITVNPKGILLKIPNTNPDFPPEYLQNCIRYNVSFVDFCGVRHNFTVSGLWTPPPFGSPAGTPGTFTVNGC